MKKSLLTLIACASIFSVVAQTPYPSTGLRALYELDNSLANSASSSYNLVPKIGNVLALTADRTNTSNKAMDRENSDAFGNATVTDNLTQFSIGAWIKLNSYTDASNLFSTIVSDLMYYFDETGWAQGSSGSYTLRVNETGILQAILIGGSGGSYTTLTSSGPLQLNQWYQVTWTMDQIEGEARLYINGEEVDVETTLITMDPPGDMEIGNVHRKNWDPNFNFYTDAEWQVFTGAIDELFIYETVLDTCTIQAIAETLPSFAISSNNGSLVVTNSPTASYAWFQCSNDQLVSGETNASFTPADNQDYYAVVTDGCVSDTTACLAIAGSTNSLEEYATAFNVYPNPSNEVLTIDVPGVSSIILTDLSGKIVATSNSAVLYTDQLSNGTYLVRVMFSSGKNGTTRVVVQH